MMYNKPFFHVTVSFCFKTVDEYYSKSSSSKAIKHVRTPLLCIQAANDPIAPDRGIPREDIKVRDNDQRLFIQLKVMCFFKSI